MLESMYEVHIGNLRRSWLAGRRAISLAHLMGLDRPIGAMSHQKLDGNAQSCPEYMWFRMNFLDRHLSLVLGLAPAWPDHRVGTDSRSDVDDIHEPNEQLERMSCEIASQILERNMLHRSSRLSPSQFLKRTKAIDLDLRRAARALPSKWWLPPDLDNATGSSPNMLLWDTRRLFAQAIHYNLLNQLHLPFMLRSSQAAEEIYHYARQTCITSSREIIARYNTLRSMDNISCGWSCRIVDVLALMAAMTLLLAHLDSHYTSLPDANILAHQAFADRARIEQVREHLEEANLMNPDSFNQKSAALLNRLLEIKIDEPTGGKKSPSLKKVSIHVSEPSDPTGMLEAVSDEADIRLLVPYFGIIRISREEGVKVVPKQMLQANILEPRCSTQSEIFGPPSPVDIRSGYMTIATAVGQSIHKGSYSIR